MRALSLVRVLVPAGRAEEARRLLAERADLPEDGELATEPSEDS